MVKNKIVFKEKVKNRIKVVEDLELIPFQKPNNKFFYAIPVKLLVYNMANDNGRETKFKWWIKNKLGEPPVVFNEPLIFGSAQSMQKYMFNLGYLHNEVMPSVKYRKQKAIVTYTVFPNKRYNINQIIIHQKSKEVEKIIANNQKKSLLKKDDYFNINILDEERQRLTNVLRNHGYYFFNKEYIRYDIDTLGKKNKVDLILKVNPPTDKKGQQKFKINDITIFTDYYAGKKINKLKLDSFDYDGYHFITESNNIKPKALLFGMFLKKGEYYSYENHNKTYRKIVGFGMFKTINFEYKVVEGNKLDIFIYLTPSKRQSLSGDVELSLGVERLLLGSSVSLTYKNKNLSKRSDLFQFRVSSGVELNIFDKTRRVLNTADLNAEVSYYLNKFIVPFPLKKVSKNSNVKTKFSVSYDFEDRFDLFVKHSTTFTAGYEWNETQQKKHFYNPFSINVLLIPFKDPSFVKQLNEIPSLAHSFEENIIFGSNYTFLMTNKKKENDPSFFKFQGDINLAGNLIHSIMLIAKNKSSDTIPYKIFGKEYAQFAKFEGNIVQHNKLNPHSELVTHFNAGIIIPYGNSLFAPYFQQFYAGGPNSLRAFTLRALGPGSYVGENSFSNGNFYYDQSGDIKIEANIEYRFDVWKWFKWAFFVDAGNVWLLNKDKERPNGHFTPKFYKDIALGFGTGLRMDFTYFVLRTDIAMPIVDPRYEDNWRLNKMNFKDITWRERNLIFSLAIGYPF